MADDMEFEQHLPPPPTRIFFSSNVPTWMMADLSRLIGSGQPAPREMLDTIRVPAGRWMVKSVEYSGGMAAEAEFVEVPRVVARWLREIEPDALKPRARKWR